VPAQGLRAELLGLLGQRAARRLMRRFGGQKIRIPYDDSARHRRNVRVIAALQTGSYAEVARRFHLSTRTLVRFGKSGSV
jgi:Mor family transcriptional regulator